MDVSHPSRLVAASSTSNGMSSSPCDEGDNDDFLMATKILTEKIRQDPSSYESYYDRSICYYKIGNFQASLDDIEAAIKLYPTHYNFHYQKAYALLGLSRVSDAVPAFKRAIELRARLNETKLSDLYLMLKDAVLEMKNVRSQNIASTLSSSVDSSGSTTISSTPSSNNNQRQIINNSNNVNNDDNNYNQHRNNLKSTTVASPIVPSYPIASSTTSDCLVGTGRTSGVSGQTVVGAPINSTPPAKIIRNKIFTTKGPGRNNEVESNSINDGPLQRPGSSIQANNNNNHINNIFNIKNIQHDQQFNLTSIETIFKNDKNNLVVDKSNSNMIINNISNSNNTPIVGQLPQNLKPGMSIAIVPINPNQAVKNDGASYSTKYKRIRRDKERARRGTCKLCIINPEDLAEMQQNASTKTMRVIAPIDQWLYSGVLSVDPNSLREQVPRYIVRLDGDPAKHPFVFSSDSVLDNVIKEVHVKTVSELRKGARICCFWNKDLSSLATGVVTSRTFEATKSLVSVKYDNGGLSALALDDLRLLPPDYPKFLRETSITLAGRFSTLFKNHNGRISQDSSTSPSSLKNIHEQLEQYQSASNNHHIQQPQHPNLQQQQQQLKLPKPTKMIMMRVLPNMKSHVQNPIQNVGPISMSHTNQLTPSHHKEVHFNRFVRIESISEKLPTKDNKDTDHHSNRLLNNDLSLAATNHDEEDSSICTDSHHEIVKEAMDQVNEMKCDDESTVDGDDINETNENSDDIINITDDNDHDEAHRFTEVANKDPVSAQSIIPATEEIIDFITRDNDTQEHFVEDGKKYYHEDDNSQLSEITEINNIDNSKTNTNDDNREDLNSSDDLDRSDDVDNSCKIIEVGNDLQLEPTVKPPIPLNCWAWTFEGPAAKKIKRNGKAYKYHYRSIRRGNEVICVGDAAELLPRDKKTLPFIAKIDSFWSTSRGMKVLVRWYYRLSETKGQQLKLEDGENALFESAHPDINDIQSIHKSAKILSWTDYKRQYLGHINDDFSNNTPNIFYIAGYYDPTLHTKTLSPDVVQSSFAQ